MTVRWPKHTFEERCEIYDFITECKRHFDPEYNVGINEINADDADLNLILMEAVTNRIIEHDKNAEWMQGHELKNRFHTLVTPWFEKVKELRKQET
jgi:hypothetical protein